MADTITVTFDEYERLARLADVVYERIGTRDPDDVRRWINRALAMADRKHADVKDYNPLPVTVVVDSTMPPDEVHFVQDGQLVGKITNLYSGYVQVHQVAEPPDESPLNAVMHHVYIKPPVLGELDQILADARANLVREYRGRPAEAAPDVPLGELTAERYFTRLGAEWDPSHREIL